MPLPVDPRQVAVTRSLRSTGITPLRAATTEQSIPRLAIGSNLLPRNGPINNEGIKISVHLSRNYWLFG
jgi:hypothetical protein